MPFGSLLLPPLASAFFRRWTGPNRPFLEHQTRLGDSVAKLLPKGFRGFWSSVREPSGTSNSARSSVAAAAPAAAFQSGNRFGKGRPTGSRNTATLALEALLDGDGEAITRKAIELAKAGNEAALRLRLERLIAPRKERPVRLKLPEDTGTAQGVSHALTAILASAAQDEITIGEAVQLQGQRRAS
jgi:hypothetical protein